MPEAYALNGPVFVGRLAADGHYEAVKPLEFPRVIGLDIDYEASEMIEFPKSVSASMTAHLNGEQVKWWRRIFRKPPRQKEIFGTMQNETDEAIIVNLEGMKRPVTLLPGQTLRLKFSHHKWVALPDIRIERKRRRTALRKKRNRG